MRRVLFVLAAFTGYVSAALSPQCKMTLADIVVSSDAACLNPTQLVPILQKDDDASVLPDLTTWLQGMCAQTPCTNAQLASLVTKFVAGCPGEATALGLDQSTEAAFISAVQAVYPIEREVLCLTTGNELCANQTLYNIQSVFGTVTKHTVLIAGRKIHNGNISDVPASIVCTDCNKEVFNILRTNSTGDYPAGLDGKLQQKCGSSFTDGQVPSTVSGVTM